MLITDPNLLKKNTFVTRSGKTQHNAILSTNHSKSEDMTTGNAKLHLKYKDKSHSKLNRDQIGIRKSRDRFSQLGNILY